MPSKEAIMFNEVLKMALGTELHGEQDFNAIRTRNAAKKQPDPPEGVSLEHVSLGGVRAERFVKAGNDKGWIFYIHGGGFTFGSARERRSITQYIADCCGYNCVSTDYRLAPENRWPAQLDDCFAAYRAFAAQCSVESIVLMGESAGGSLVLSLALALKKHAIEYPEDEIIMPKALVALSPCVTMAEHFPSHTYNIKNDIILKDMILKGLEGPLFGEGVLQETLRDPLVSPLYGDYSGLPPVFISCTDAETLYDDARELYRRLKEAGHKTGFDMQPGLCHAFQINTMLPEARESLQKAFQFIGETK